MKITISERIFYAVVGLVMTACAVLVYAQAAPAHANVGTANVISTATTSAAISVTTTTRVLATTTNPLGVPGTTSFTRVYATICTQSSNPVALNLDGDKAANGTTGNVTAWIAAAAGYSTCYEITDKNQYSGAVTASSTSQAATLVTVKDYVQ
jgi:hypothetical protein